MTDSVRRYDIYMHSDEIQFLRECPDGDYVRWNDYDQLAARLAASEAEVAVLKAKLIDDDHCAVCLGFDEACGKSECPQREKRLRRECHSLRDKLAKLQEEEEFSIALIDRLGGLLNDTANALKGPPDELALHSTHDLAKVSAALVAECDSLRDKLVQTRDALLIARRHVAKSGESGSALEMNTIDAALQSSEKEIP